MKSNLQNLVTGMIFVIAFTITTSCAITVSDGHPPRHRQRVVWIAGVQYRQAYYLQDNDVVIVNQEMVKQKPRHENHGRRKGH
jgi:hypothetical protein